MKHNQCDICAAFPQISFNSYVIYLALHHLVFSSMFYLLIVHLFFFPFFFNQLHFYKSYVVNLLLGTTCVFLCNVKNGFRRKKKEIGECQQINTYIRDVKQEEMKLKSHMIELKINLNYFLKVVPYLPYVSWHCQS